MILFDRKFGPLYWIQFLGALNDNFLKNGMVILIEYRGLSLLGLDPPAIVALAGAIFILPFFMFSMLAGQIADRFQKTRIVRFVKLWELLIAGAASVGFLTENLPVLLLALFMMGCHSSFFGPIKYSALPDLVPPSSLVRANAFVEVGTFLAILIGTIGGGFFIALPNGEKWISLAICVCALVGLATSWLMEPIPSHAENLQLQWKPFALMWQTTRLMQRKSVVYHSVIGISWFWAFGAAVLSLLPPYCKEYLHVDAHVVTAFLAMFTIGIGIGSIVGERLSGNKVELGLVPFGALGLALFLVDLSLVRLPNVASGPLLNLAQFAATPHGPRLFFDFTMMSMFGGLFILPLYTTLQSRSDRRVRSRVIAGNNVFNAIFMVIGAGFVMLFHIYKISLPNTFLALAGFHVLACTYIYTLAPELRMRFLSWIKARRTLARV